MKNSCISTAVLLLWVSPATFAIELESIIVTATRAAQTADESLASVTIITRDDIERTQAQNVEELLRGVPGLKITNSGGMGKATSVFLRGAESDHVLVLINGLKVGSATLGTTAFQHIPVEQIDRIEIVRGPRSSLYGSEAIGGVIQIFTRKGGGATESFINVGGGSYRTQKTSAGVSGGGKRGWYSLSANSFDTEGFNACNGKPSPGGAGCFTSEPDKDGYKQLSGSLRVGYRFENKLELDAHVLHTTGEAEFDGVNQNESEFVQQVLGGSLVFSPVPLWQFTLTVGRSQDESDNFKDGAFSTRFETSRDSVSWQNDFTIMKDHLLTLGVDKQDDNVGGTTNYAVKSQNNKGLFTQYQGTYSAHDMQLSLRQDDNEQFGHHRTGSAAWSYEISNTLRLTSSFGTAYKAPTFNELYYPGYGNPNLGPEESRSYEFGFSGKANRASWSVSTYKTLVDNLIAYDASIPGPGNVDQARILGAEMILASQIYGWDIKTNLTLLRAKNLSDGTNKDNILPRRAQQSLQFDVDNNIGNFSLGATIHAEGKRYDDLANSRELSGYAVVGLRAGYTFVKEWKLQVRGVNLFDKDYETAAYYNQPGRSLYVSLSYKQ